MLYLIKVCQISIISYLLVADMCSDLSFELNQINPNQIVIPNEIKSTKIPLERFLARPTRVANTQCLHSGLWPLNGKFI